LEQSHGARLQDIEIERFIEEDIPYGDLTTHLLNIGSIRGKITFTTREDTIICGTEEAGRILEKCGAKVTLTVPSGTASTGSKIFFVAEGSAQSLHAGWAVAVNLLEYASGIATCTAKIVRLARLINPSIAVVTSRKCFPGTRKLAIKAIVAGGALPHHLSLSETILVSRQHTLFTGGLDAFLNTLPKLLTKVREPTIIVEAGGFNEALRIARTGVDVLQVDKLPTNELKELVDAVRDINSSMKISVTGDINERNVSEYAATGVDIIVLSSVYFSTPSDIVSSLVPV
jgi:molybdenum transport protein